MCMKKKREQRSSAVPDRSGGGGGGVRAMRGDKKKSATGTATTTTSTAAGATSAAENGALDGIDAVTSKEVASRPLQNGNPTATRTTICGIAGASAAPNLNHNNNINGSDGWMKEETPEGAVNMLEEVTSAVAFIRRFIQRSPTLSTPDVDRFCAALTEVLLSEYPAHWFESESIFEYGGSGLNGDWADADGGGGGSPPSSSPPATFPHAHMSASNPVFHRTMSWTSNTSGSYRRPFLPDEDETEVAIQPYCEDAPEDFARAMRHTVGRHQQVIISGVNAEKYFAGAGEAAVGCGRPNSAVIAAAAALQHQQHQQQQQQQQSHARGGGASSALLWSDAGGMSSSSCVGGGGAAEVVVGEGGSSGLHHSQSTSAMMSHGMHHLHHQHHQAHHSHHHPPTSSVSQPALGSPLRPSGVEALGHGGFRIGGGGGGGATSSAYLQHRHRGSPVKS